MKLAKFILFISGLVWVVYGSWLIVDPKGLSYAGFELEHWSPIVEIMAMYGFVELGLGLFAWMGIWKPERYMHSALVVWSFIYGGLSVGRILGLSLYGGDFWVYTFGPEGLPNSYNAGALWFLELPSFILCLLSLRLTTDKL